MTGESGMAQVAAAEKCCGWTRKKTWWTVGIVAAVLLLIAALHVCGHHGRRHGRGKHDSSRCGSERFNCGERGVNDHY
ncbi:MAG TPA: hypothetical protein PKM88_15790, partial [bacterium]|nr:hypothetical protein [bacterium]